jgi:transcriptional regulator with XRE-family HTH domain
MRSLILPIIMDNDFNQAMAQRLIRLRKLSGLTQVDVAKLLGISQGTYAHYERGFRRIPLERIPRIAEALNTNEEDLLGLERKNTKRGPASGLERRFEKIQSLPAKEQRFVIEMIDRVLGDGVKAS